MMSSWEDVWWLFTQPLFIGLLLCGVLLKPLLKYLRRFYPASWQEEIKRGKEFAEEVEKSYKDVYLVKKGRQYTATIVFLPPSVVFSFYLLYTYLQGGELSPYFVRESVVSIFSPVMMLSLGILTLNDESIFKYLFKEDYPRYKELSQKLYGADRYIRFIDKHKKVVGWFFIFLGLLTFLGLGGYIGDINVK